MVPMSATVMDPVELDAGWEPAEMPERHSWGRGT